mgnify:CR=1 FL=1
MCMDSRAINNIIIKCRYPIPKLDDKLNELSSSKVLLSIDIRSVYNHIRVRDGISGKQPLRQSKHCMRAYHVMWFV